MITPWNKAWVKDSSMEAKSAFKMLAFAALAGVITEACRRRTL